MHTYKYLKYSAMPVKTLCILLVAMFLAGIIQFIITGIYWEFSRTHHTPEQPPVILTEQQQQQKEIDNAQKEFSPDGTIYLVNTNVTSPGNFDEKKTIVKDQHNQVLFTGIEEDNPYSFIQWHPKTKNRNRHYRNIDQRYLNELDLIGGEFSRHFVVPMVDVYNKRIGHWFFDIDKRIFKYYSVSGEQLGYLGANGYTENKSDALAFEECHQMRNWLRPDSYDPMMIYESQHVVYQIDFQNRQVETLVRSDNDPIRRVILMNWQETEIYGYRPALAVFTESGKFYLRLKNPEQTIETQLPSDFGYFDIPQFAANDKTIFARLSEIPEYPKTKDWNIIRSWHNENRNKDKEHRVRLFEVDKSGNFSEKSSFVWAEPARQRNVVTHSTWESIYPTVNSLSSPIPAWLTRHWLKTGNYRQGPVWRRAIMEFIKPYSAFKTPINLCVMAVFAALALLHGWPRRTQMAKLIFWVVFVFLFNLPGFLTYLALNHTPLIHCANCGKKRGLGQDACCRCGTTLSLPESKETDLISVIV